jgi:hypothetical protein
MADEGKRAGCSTNEADVVFLFQKINKNKNWEHIPMSNHFFLPSPWISTKEWLTA